MALLRTKNTSLAFPFMRYSMVALCCSVLLMLATVGLLATRGLNLGIDFAGGILLEIHTASPADLAQLRAVLNNPEYGAVSLQQFGNAHDVLIRASGNPQSQQSVTVEAMKQQLVQQVGEGNIEFRRIDYVGATVGSEMLHNGIWALVIAFAAMLCYIWMRFEWQFGVGGLLALFHDAVLTIGFYSLMGYEFGLTAIAALLTVIGYSINDSVVIYDRIRDIVRKSKSKTLSEVIDIALNQTLSRTLLTGVTTLLAAGALGVLGGEAIRSFAFALCFGVLIGTYSSLYISAPVLLYLRLPLNVFDRTESKESPMRAVGKGKL
jgi:preprotein translocase subunit SecF